MVNDGSTDDSMDVILSFQGIAILDIANHGKTWASRIRPAGSARRMSTSSMPTTARNPV